MAMDINRFEKIKDKARKLIKEDAKVDSAIIKERQADRERTYRSLKSAGVAAMTGFENIAPSYGSNGTSIGSLNENYSDDNSEERLYAAIDNYRGSRQVQQAAVPATKIPTQMNSGLPKEILESFSNNYIDQSVFDPNKSVLDKMGITGDNVQQPTQENYVPQQQTSGGKIDYELIKAIVESAVKKQVGALAKKMITEGNNDLAMIQVGGKKINLVTKSGDIYEATLVKKYNIKDKKKESIV